MYQTARWAFLTDMVMGRPTEYSADILQAAKDYLETYVSQGDVIPTIEGLADNLGRGVKTLYNWAKEHEEFEEAMNAILSKQGRLLQNKGLNKETDSSITKLLLSANHDKREKSEQKNEHAGNVTIVTKIPDVGGVGV